MKRFNAVPGSYAVHVDEFDRHAPADPVRRAAFESLAVPLSSLRERLGGDAGLITGFEGDEQPLSLAEWASADPATRLVVYFTFQQADAPLGYRGSVYPSDVLIRTHASP